MKCLDTDFLVAVLRKKREAEHKMEELDVEGRQATSTISAFELFYGAQKSQMIEKNTAETRSLLSRLLIIPFSLGAAEKAGSIFAGLERKGMVIDSRDAMIAGAALDSKLSIVTRNRKDYSRIPGLQIEEW